VSKLVLVTPIMVTGTGCALAVIAATRHPSAVTWGAAALLIVAGLFAWVVSA
jgi:hypothetical protein